MLSKNQVKHIRQLSKKKYRQESRMFVAEGEKVVYELLDSGWKAEAIYAAREFKGIPHTMVHPSVLDKITHLSSASPLLGLFKIPQYDVPLDHKAGFSVALDSIADPGNLGTIIRLCHWFGIKDLFCSTNTVDCFNPKVIQSTMGSIARVRCHYLDLAPLVENYGSDVYATTLKGSSHYVQSFPSNGLLVMGSESHGISETLLKKIKKQITIPNLSQGTTAESLNVATATAILLNEIFRPQ
ncbi:MAG: RNA methyltransferase [Flavobacteriaceae bacterium]|nr:RNA methyltransferase [Flavobacteriaceae bacterium]